MWMCIAFFPFFVFIFPIFICKRVYVCNCYCSNYYYFLIILCVGGGYYHEREKKWMERKRKDEE